MLVHVLVSNTSPALAILSCWVLLAAAAPPPHECMLQGTLNPGVRHAAAHARHIQGVSNQHPQTCACGKLVGVHPPPPSPLCLGTRSNPHMCPAALHSPQYSFQERQRKGYTGQEEPAGPSRNQTHSCWSRWLERTTHMLSRGDQGLDQCSNPHKLPPIGVLLLVLFTETHGICWGCKSEVKTGTCGCCCTASS